MPSLRVCIHCNKQFVPPRSYRLLCSAACQHARGLQLRRRNDLANPERRSTQRRRFYRKHRLRLLAQMRAYVARNRARRKAYAARYYQTHKAELKKKMQAYRRTHLDRIKQLGRLYYLANRERHRQRCRQYNLCNHAKLVALHQRYYQANRECIKRRTRAWGDANPERRREYAAKTRMTERERAYKRVDAAKRRAVIAAYQRLVGRSADIRKDYSAIKRAFERQLGVTINDLC